MALSRLKEKLTKENLWIYILGMLKKEPMYGYEIASRLRNDLHINTAIITIYVVLYRMEKEKLIERQKTQEGGSGLKRVYYTVTDSGNITFEQGMGLIETTLRTLRAI